MCMNGVTNSWLYLWKVEYLTKKGEKVVNEGVYPSGLDSNHEAKEIMNEAYNKTLNWGEKIGKRVHKFLGFSYKVALGGYR